MMGHGCGFSYCICNAFLKRSKIKFLPFMDCSRSIWYLCKKWIKSEDFVCNINNHNYTTINLRNIEKFSLVFVDDINLGFIAWYISHSPDLLRAPIILRTCGLIFSKYSFIDDLSFSLLYSAYLRWSLLWFINYGCVIYFWFKVPLNFSVGIIFRLFHRPWRIVD